VPPEGSTIIPRRCRDIQPIASWSPTARSVRTPRARRRNGSSVSCSSYVRSSSTVPQRHCLCVPAKLDPLTESSFSTQEFHPCFTGRSRRTSLLWVRLRSPRWGHAGVLLRSFRNIRPNRSSRSRKQPPTGPPWSALHRAVRQPHPSGRQCNVSRSLPDSRSMDSVLLPPPS